MKGEEKVKVWGTLNRTNVELKLVVHPFMIIGINALNRTNVELKLCVVTMSHLSTYSLNRTNVELKSF